MRKTLTEVTLPQWLGYLERWLEVAGTTFFVGNDITICDLVIYTRMKWLSRGVSEITICSTQYLGYFVTQWHLVYDSVELTGYDRHQVRDKRITGGHSK